MPTSPSSSSRLSFDWKSFYICCYEQQPSTWNTNDNMQRKTESLPADQSRQMFCPWEFDAHATKLTDRKPPSFSYCRSGKSKVKGRANFLSKCDVNNKHVITKQRIILFMPASATCACCPCSRKYRTVVGSRQLSAEWKKYNENYSS